MRRLTWADRAKLDLADIEAFWMDERPDYVENLYNASAIATRFLIETPGAGSPIGSTGLRKWRIGRTPYLLFYRVTRDTIRVVRVRHEHESWRRR